MKQPLTMINGGTKQAESQDVALWNEVNRIFYSFKKTAFGKELKKVFENLNDKKLIEALEKTRRTGRPGYPIKVMWRSLIVSYVLNISTIQELIRMLHRNPFTAIQCGIFYENEIPSRFAYYRFIKKLITHKVLIEKCMAETINGLQKKLSEFGNIVAVDSTDISTYSNKYKKPPSDPDARWGYKKNSNGVEKNWLGYKMHLVSDVKYEIPLMPIITPANAHDSPMMIPVLEQNKGLIDNFSPKFILADKGYDASNNYRSIVHDFKAIPIIDLNLRRLKKKPDILNNIKDEYRRFIKIPRYTKKWHKLYNKRVSIERIFSRLKKDGDGKLVNHRIRGFEKITLNCLLSVWVMQSRAPSSTF